jgi:hypothetical protein
MGKNQFVTFANGMSTAVVYGEPATLPCHMFGYLSSSNADTGIHSSS